jgi:predicted secreted hydrolase
LQFPRDLGSHPDFAIEWWYLTGRVQAAQREFGFQLTFFRSRVSLTQGMRSSFAAKQLIFAHAAVTDVAGKRLLHDQRIARASGNAQVDLASASEVDTAVQLGDWSLQRDGNSYQAKASASDFSFQLTLRETQPLLLQGDQGWSRKGPETKQASFYYSLPQLQVSGQVSVAGQTLPVQGQAWLDHEWSQSLMHPDAVGWDWIGMNLLDGSALTAFRLRTKEGGTLWAGGSLRAAGSSQAEIFGPEDVIFTPQRHWKSPASGASYPVQWSVQIRRAGSPATEPVLARYTVNAVIDNQELDSRQSTGAIYWEGLSELLDSRGTVVGRGYLEMTGYASLLRL